MRWSCPADVGYACTDAFGATLLYGDPDRVAPCTAQPAGAQWSFRVFFLLVPAVCYLLAAVPAWRMSISADAHCKIMQQLREREMGQARASGAQADPACSGGARGETVATAPQLATDPLTGRLVRLPDHGAVEVFLQHFSSSERSYALRQSGPLRALRRLMLARLGTWLGLVLLQATVMAVLSAAGGKYEMVFTTVVTLGCLGLAGLAVLLAWDAARLRATWHAPSVAWSTLEGDDELHASRPQSESRAREAVLAFDTDGAHL